MPRSLIVNADDFGLSEGVSRGIIKAHRRGILTSTSFMVNFPWAEEMAPLLEKTPELGVGIHLNLTTGTPVLPLDEVPTLVGPDGQFSKSLIHLFSRVDLAQVQCEWSAQVAKGIRLLGRRPTHLDTHRYLQSLPGFAEAMVAVARAHGVPAVRCLHPGPGLAISQMYGTWNPTRLLVERYMCKSAALITQSGLASPQATLAGDFDLPLLLRRLELVGDGVTEMVTHPGIVDDRLRTLSSLQEHREVELDALTSPEVRQKVTALGIRLITFGNLVSG